MILYIELRGVSRQCIPPRTSYLTPYCLIERLPGPGVVPLSPPKGHATLPQGYYSPPLPDCAPLQGTLVLSDSVMALTPDVPWLQNEHEGGYPI